MKRQTQMQMLQPMLMEVVLLFLVVVILDLSNSTVAQNTLISSHILEGSPTSRLTSYGGGIYFAGGSAIISNCTIAENILAMGRKTKTETGGIMVQAFIL